MSDHRGGLSARVWLVDALFPFLLREPDRRRGGSDPTGGVSAYAAGAAPLLGLRHYGRVQRYAPRYGQIHYQHRGILAGRMRVPCRLGERDLPFRGKKHWVDLHLQAYFLGNCGNGQRYILPILLSQTGERTGNGADCSNRKINRENRLGRGGSFLEFISIDDFRTTFKYQKNRWKPFS